MLIARRASDFFSDMSSEKTVKYCLRLSAAELKKSLSVLCVSNEVGER